MVHLYHDDEAQLELLQDKQIAVIGYGSQGHAHALNLRDNGCNVLIGLPRESKRKATAEAAGFQVLMTAEAAKEADLIALLIPDELHHTVFERDILPGLNAGKTLLTAHGFSLHYGQITPPEDIDVIMVAPNGPGPMLRKLFLEGFSTLGLWAVYQDASGQAEATALAYARGIGCTRAGVMHTTFPEETETDLFSEQVVLCGGITALIRAAFETLVRAGYQPEIAFTCCMQELQLTVDLLYQGGMNYMHQSISDTAEYGDYLTGPRIINQHTYDEMEKVLRDIQDGTFAKNWVLENQAGRPSFRAMRRMYAQHPIEQVGSEVRAMMPWLNKANEKP
jgi:ketol-acid reductoisomerase